MIEPAQAKYYSKQDLVSLILKECRENPTTVKRDGKPVRSVADSYKKKLNGMSKRQLVEEYNSLVMLHAEQTSDRYGRARD